MSSTVRVRVRGRVGVRVRVRVRVTGIDSHIPLIVTYESCCGIGNGV